MIYACTQVLPSGKKCGNFKSGHPYGSAKQKPWLCHPCRKRLERERLARPNLQILLRTAMDKLMAA